MVRDAPPYSIMSRAFLFSAQVTAQDVSSMIRFGLNPIIFLVNNSGYTIEVTSCSRNPICAQSVVQIGLKASPILLSLQKEIHDGPKDNNYNDIQPWCVQILAPTTDSSFVSVE